MRNKNTARKYGTKVYTSNRMKQLRHTLYGVLATLGKERKDHVVTVDDVHSALNTLRVSKNDMEARLSLTNKVFSNPMFKRTGYVVPSARPAAKYRLVNEWKVVR